jgi:ABC-type oligopeptide transport system ATPase subunit
MEKDMNNSILLEVKNLQVYFPVFGGVFQKKVAEVKAVDGISFTIHRGETFGLVGESGCGKTTVGRAIINVLTHVSPDVHIGGEILYHDKDGTVHNITKLSSSAMKVFRSKIQMIFQDPYSSLNSRLSVKQIISEPLEIHEPQLSQKEVEDKVLWLLEKVGLQPEYANRFPHQSRTNHL